jgi:hypothetical protein
MNHLFLHSGGFPVMAFAGIASRDVSQIARYIQRPWFKTGCGMSAGAFFALL